MYRRPLGWLGIAAIALLISLLVGLEGKSILPAVSAEIPLLAQVSADEATTPASAELSFSGVYEDAQGTFQIGILDGAITTTAGDAPLFALPDGSLAYSVVSWPLNGDAPLSEVALVALANQVLSNGEGFQTQTFVSVPEGLQIEWTGRLSQGNGPPQAVSGRILANQQGATVYLLVLAAFEDAAAQVPQTLVALADSLKLL